MDISKDGEGGGKRRGRKSNVDKEVLSNKEQCKFFVDLSKDKEELAAVIDILRRCNSKSEGRAITFKDLCLILIPKVTEKDIEKLQDQSLSEMEKVERLLIEHNKKTGSNLSMGEFLIKKLGIN